MSKGSATRVPPPQNVDTSLPAVKNRRGVSGEVNKILTASAGKNIVGMRANFRDMIPGSGEEERYTGPLNIASN